MFEVEVWVIPAKREILVTDFPGPPAEICGLVSEEAAKAAEARGYATVSEIGFPTDLYLGKFGGGEYHAWMDALDVASDKAKELGYEIRIEDSQWLPESEWEEAPSEEEFLAELYECWEEVEDE